MRVLRAHESLSESVPTAVRCVQSSAISSASEKQIPLQIISPIAWTDELSTGRWRGGLPRDRRVTLDGLIVDHPRYLYTPKVLRYWYGPFFRSSVRKTFARVLEEFRPDIILAPWAYPDGWAAVELGHSAGLPVVIKVHGSDIRLLSHYPGRRSRTAEALQRADGVVAVSKELSGQIMNLNVDPDKIHVAYSGVDFEIVPPRIQDRSPRTTGPSRRRIDSPVIGNLVPVKGIDVLIDSCSFLAQAGTRFACYLVGQERFASCLGTANPTVAIGRPCSTHGSQASRSVAGLVPRRQLFVLPADLRVCPRSCWRPWPLEHHSLPAELVESPSSVISVGVDSFVLTTPGS